MYTKEQLIEAFRLGFVRGFTEGKTRAIISKKYFADAERAALDEFEKDIQNNERR